MLRLLLMSLFLFAASPAWAATYYMATTGSDSNSCASSQTITTPKLTFASAVACLTTAGDLLYVRGGVYTDRIYYPNFVASGTAQAPIIIKNYNGETVTIKKVTGCYSILFGTRNWITIDGINVDQGPANFTRTSCNVPSGTNGGGPAVSVDVGNAPIGITLKNLTIANSPTANLFFGSQHLVENVVVTGTGWGLNAASAANSAGSTGLYMEVQNSIVRHSLIYNNDCFGLRFGSNAGVTPSTNNIAEYNIVHTNGNGKGLSGAAQDCSSGPSTPFGGGIIFYDSSNIARHNLVYNNSGVGIWIYPGPASTTNASKLYNNTVTTSNRGITVQTAAVTNTVLTNNHVIGNATTQINDVGTGTVQTTNRTTGSLTDCTVSSSDFTQKASSSCIGAGTAITGLAYNGTLPDQGWSETFGFSSATINNATLDISFSMGLNTPVAGITAAQFTAACSGSNCGTPVVSTAAILPSSDSVVRLTLTGLGGSAVCEAGQTWTVSGTRTAVTDSALLGSNVVGTGVNQPVVAFTTSAVTNACAVGVTSPTFTQLASSTFTRPDESPLSEVNVWTSTNGSTGLKIVSNAVNPISNTAADSSARYTALTFNADQYSRADLTTVGTNGSGAGMALIVRGSSGGTDNYRFAIDHHASDTTNAELTRTVSGVITALGSCTPSGNPWTQAFTNGDTFTIAVAGETVYVYDDSTTLVKTCVDTGGGVPTPGYPGVAHSTDTTAGTLADNWFGGNFSFSAPPPATGTFSQVAGQFSSAVTPFGTLGAVNAANTNVRRGTAVSLVLQTDCTAANCDPIGERLFYSRNGGAYAQVPNRESVGPDGISFYGATSDPSYITGAPTCPLSGVLTTVAGATLYTADSIPLFDLAQDNSYCQRFVLLVAATAVLNDTIEFKAENQTNALFSSYTPANGAKLTVTPAATITAPTNLTAVGASSNTIIEMVWAPVVDGAILGYYVYQCSATPCTVATGTKVATNTALSAAAAHTSITLFRTVVATAATYYFAVSALDSGGQESALSNEIAVVRTGFTAPAVRVP